MQSSLPALTLAAYWEDLIAEGGTQQGVYYQIDNANTATPTVTFEFLLANLGIQDQYYHFLVTYNAVNPGAISIYYFVTPDNGAGANIGIQGGSVAGKYHIPTRSKSFGCRPAYLTKNFIGGEQAIMYSSDGNTSINPGQVVTFDTFAGTASLSTFNNACYTAGSWPSSTC